jgi:hypothetical protein
MASIGKQDSGKAELENRTVDTMVGDGSDTTLVLSSVPISINNVLIFISGVMQRPTTDYTLSGSTITFSEAPIAGLKVVAITGGGEHIGIPLTKLGTDKFMESAVTDAKIASGISASKLTGAMPALDGSAVTGAGGANVSGVDTVTTSDPAVNTDPASAGHIWLNRTTAEMFVCTDNTAGANVWINVGEGIGGIPYMSATNTNGTETTDGDYKVVTFNTSGSFTPTIGVAGLGDFVEYLVIAGGGGGGFAEGGGGGAGGYLTATNFTVTNTNLTVTVGAGGNGGVVSPSADATAGQNSVFSTITSTGGGLGGTGSTTAAKQGGAGGSGGGSSNNGAGAGTAGAASPAGQGFAGGTADAVATYNAGGGGGAGAVGADGPGGTVGGAGGVGLSSDIVVSGANVIRAGGGGGGSFRGTSTGGAGGAGGGGTGTGSTGGTASAGTTNLGGGGGGGGFSSGPAYGGGNGGSGVVIVRYRFK